MRGALRLIIFVLALAACAPAGAAISVKGNRLVDGKRPLRLVGVNRSGTEFACTGPLAGQEDGPFGYGVFQGPVDERSVRALKTWKVNAVALPLNEACWLGGYGNLSPQFSGKPYRSAIKRYVKRLHSGGIAVVLRLSGAAPGDRPFGTIQDGSSNEVPMADTDHSLAFWRSLAKTFKADGRVLFHAFDEPHDLSWACLLSGCPVTDPRYGTYDSAGHQAIVDAIRDTGARQPIILAGPDYAGDLSEWLAHRPRDPRHALVADVSSFDYADYVIREKGTVASVAKKVPVIIGGFGDTDCNSDYSEKVMDIADRLKLSELAWTWNTVQDYGGCQNALLDGDDAYYTGNPSGFGAGIRSHYRALDRRR